MLWINLSYLILFISATGIGFAGLTILEKVCGQHREYTTGNTANECARILKTANCKNILIFTIAKD